MTEKLEHNVLIIPDVHCRAFWKADIERFRNEIESGSIEVVFMGDYLDPYGFEQEEGIAETVEKGIEMLKEIIELAKKHKNVHLLLGNHDFHYFDDEYAKHIYLCRYCTHFAEKIKSLFRDNKDVFSLAWDCFIDDTLVLFTHAGVLKGWVDMCFEGNTIKRPDADFMNNLLETGNVLPLAMIGPDRGGKAFSVGSPIWADYQEHIYGWLLEQALNRRKQIVYKDKIYQIFAHNLSEPGCYPESLDNYEINEHFAMLDARKSFILEPDGKIKEARKVE